MQTSGVKGLASGALSLLLLHALVARANQDQLEGLTNDFVHVVQRFLDPNIPAIPDRGAEKKAREEKASAEAKAASTKAEQQRKTIPAPTQRSTAPAG